MTARVERPWAALWALVLGFFMILVDTTIASVAGPSIMQALDATITETLWATSAYLLAYAVPLLVTGRLGDRFGPRRMYLIGLALFTISSLACGLAPTIEVLIVSRVAQGLGASLMTPQTMAVITRIFAPNARGAAMGLWGATAGVATLVGPILGGILLDSLGWEWIFFVNVPVGIVGFILAMKYVPVLGVSFRKFDGLGVVLSATGVFFLVFGFQEGARIGEVTGLGVWAMWGMAGIGVVILIVFVLWQRIQRGEPLMPLQIFHDRNFSLGTAAITTVGFAITSMSLPIMFYLQMVRGFTPTQSALLLAPTAIISGVIAPFVGRMIDRRDPRPTVTTGTILIVAGLVMYTLVLTPTSPVWLLIVPSVIMGFANGLVWSPLASITTYQLPPKSAGAGSGVYNTTRQVGSVLGSASIAAAMNAFLVLYLGAAGAGIAEGFGGEGAGLGGVTVLPADLHEGFSNAMSLSLILPAAVMAIGAILTLFFERRRPLTSTSTIPTVTGPVATTS